MNKNSDIGIIGTEKRKNAFGYHFFWTGRGLICVFVRGACDTGTRLCVCYPLTVLCFMVVGLVGGEVALVGGTGLVCGPFISLWSGE